MRYLLDTNILSDLVRDPQGAVARRLAQHAESDLFTSIIVACELRYGAAKRGSASLSQRIEQLLGSLEVAALEPGVDEVLDEVRRAHVVERVGRQRQRAAVAASGHEADRGLLAAGLGRRGGVVVDAHQHAALLGERGRAVGETAAEVEEPATGVETIPHLAVARGVQRQERVGRLALDGAFTGEFHGSVA